MIIVFYLEFERFFLHVCSCSQKNKSDAQLMLEAELYSDYMKKYKPISIVNRYNTEYGMDIDRYVKIYMIGYGIDYVRGGSYSDEILSESQLNVLLRELDTASSSINKKHEDIVENLIQTYVYNKSALTKSAIGIERKKLEETLANYKKEKTEYDSIYIHGSQIMDDIQWISETCSQIVEIYNTNKQNSFLFKLIKKEFIEKYKRVLVSLRTVYTICKTYEYSKYNTEKIYVKYPQFVLDDFFYHCHYMNDVSIIRVEQLCHTYKHMTNIIVNKMAEKEFDIASWGENIEWKIPRALYLLDKIDHS
jgi:hypothetical protein